MLRALSILGIMTVGLVSNAQSTPLNCHSVFKPVVRIYEKSRKFSGPSDRAIGKLTSTQTPEGAMQFLEAVLPVSKQPSAPKAFEVTTGKKSVMAGLIEQTLRIDNVAPQLPDMQIRILAAKELASPTLDAAPRFALVASDPDVKVTVRVTNKFVEDIQFPVSETEVVFLLERTRSSVYAQNRFQELRLVFNNIGPSRLIRLSVAEGKSILTRKVWKRRTMEINEGSDYFERDLSAH